jgi:hypothetical protein
MQEEQFEKLVRMAKREERERILGILEFYVKEWEGSLNARMLKQVIDTIEEK